MRIDLMTKWGLYKDVTGINVEAGDKYNLEIQFRKDGKIVGHWKKTTEEDQEELLKKVGQALVGARDNADLTRIFIDIINGFVVWEGETISDVTTFKQIEEELEYLKQICRSERKEETMESLKEKELTKEEERFYMAIIGAKRKVKYPLEENELMYRMATANAIRKLTEEDELASIIGRTMAEDERIDGMILEEEIIKRIDTLLKDIDRSIEIDLERLEQIKEHEENIEGAKGAKWEGQTKWIKK